MGYGLNTAKEHLRERRWGSHIFWYVKQPRANLALNIELLRQTVKAMDIWENMLNERMGGSVPKVLFIRTALDKHADFLLDIPPRNEGSTSWSPKAAEGSVGRPPILTTPQNEKAVLTIGDKDATKLGVILHEIGHLLGLSHEQDRRDTRETFYSAKGDPIGIIGAKRNAKNNTTFKTAYDEKSVMHYSHGKYNYSTYEKPSDGDIEMAILVNDAFADRDGKLLDGK